MTTHSLAPSPCPSFVGGVQIRAGIRQECVSLLTTSSRLHHCRCRRCCELSEPNNDHHQPSVTNTSTSTVIDTHQRQTTMQYYSLTGIAANHPSQPASPPLFTTCPVLSTITLLSVSAVARVPPRPPLPQSFVFNY